MVLNLPNYTGEYSTGYWFYRSYEVGVSTNSETVEVELNFSNEAKAKKLGAIFFQAYGIKKAKVTGNFSGVETYEGFMDYTRNLQVLDMEFDFTSCSTAYSVRIYNNYGSPVLTHLRFKKNTLSISISLLALAALDDDSCVSIANGLNANATGQTLTLDPVPKAKCSSIVGTVNDGFFTQDAQGTVTLSDFITNTKGWTLA